MVDIAITEEENYHILTVKGEVDASSSIDLDNGLEQAADSAKNILVDLTELSYISSAGLGVFISYLDELKTKNVELVLFGLNQNVLEVFHILGLQNLIHITQNKEEAVRLLG